MATVKGNYKIMAEFDRKALRKIFEAAEIEVPKDVLGQICELHTSANEDLSEAVKTLRTDLENVEHERDAYKAKAPKDGEETISKSEYDRIVQDFNDYRNEIATKETKRTKEHAIRELLKGVGVSEKRLDTILRVTNLDDFELDENGDIKDADRHVEKAKSEWSDFIETTVTKGANTATPPANNGGKTMTKAEIYKKDENGRYVLSASERQKALAENLNAK